MSGCAKIEPYPSYDAPDRNSQPFIPRQEKMSNTYFTSDLHFGHQNIIRYCARPFETARGMDEALISNWNSVVGVNDKIWILGDVFFCERDRAAEILTRLNGEKHLILGNHDRMIRNQVPIQQMFTKVYPDLHHENIDGILVAMCHYPMQSWNKAGRGSFMLHGHVHSSTPTDGQYRRYDVGVDANNYTPVSWKSIKKTLENIQSADSRKREADAM